MLPDEALHAAQRRKHRDVHPLGLDVLQDGVAVATQLPARHTYRTVLEVFSVAYILCYKCTTDIYLLIKRPSNRKLLSTTGLLFAK